MADYDVIIIGGGIAGVSIGFELSADHRVCLLEMESTLAFHTTGRSAATYIETYGGPQIRALTTASRAFLESPPEYFESALMTPRPMLLFAKAGAGADIEAHYREVVDLVPEAQLLNAGEVERLMPVARAGFVDNGLYDPGAMELDVHGLHQGYVRGLRARGGVIHKSAGVVELSRENRAWTARTADGAEVSAPLVVNAAGAWGDHVAQLAAARPVGLRPLRRTIFMTPSPGGAATKDLPIFGDVDATFYIKPEGDQFLCSPADETLCPAGEVSADSLEIARAIDDINAATTLAVRTVSSSWAGLRSFVADRNFVVGHDPQVEGFFWFVGQGGYGIQTAPASARVGAAMIRGADLPADVLQRGLDPRSLAPDRASLAPAAGV